VVDQSEYSKSQRFDLEDCSNPVVFMQAIDSTAEVLGIDDALGSYWLLSFGKHT